MEKSKDKKENDDEFEIPVGKYVSSFKKNPWIVSTIVLIVVVVVLAVLLMKGTNVNSNYVSGEKAAGNLLTFLSTQVQAGDVRVISVEEESSLYKVIVEYQGQQVPLYVSLDGAYLISDVVPINSGTGSDIDSNNQEKVEVSIDDDAMIGSKDAKVTIVEFSDYQCPFCRKFWTETYGQLKKDYIDTGKANLVFRDFPLDFHPSAQISGEAAECVREKGGDAAYFKYHDKMFSEQNILDSGSANGAVSTTVTYGEAELVKWAKDLGYDIQSCLDSGKYTSEVQKDLQEGASYGVSGTPAFFVNGKLLSGAQPYSAFKAAIDAELA